MNRPATASRRVWFEMHSSLDANDQFNACERKDCWRKFSGTGMLSETHIITILFKIIEPRTASCEFLMVMSSSILINVGLFRASFEQDSFITLCPSSCVPGPSGIIAGDFILSLMACLIC